MVDLPEIQSHPCIGIRQDMPLIQSVASQYMNKKSSGQDKFMVPYQRNPYFKGRTELLETLHSKLCEILPDRYNHRIALYGLGGVGKTQLALEYVNRHWDKKTYDQVYW